MSMGIGGWCQMTEQNEDAVIYKYGAYNLNEPSFRNEERLQDGLIIICKESLVVPILFEELYEKGFIEIHDCGHCWKTSLGDKDYIAWRLIYKIFQFYQETGQFPKQVSYDI